MAVTGTAAIETYRVEQFANAIEMLVQQRGSKLRNLVSTQGMSGSKGARMMNQVGSATIEKVVTRHADTPINPISADGRWVYPTHYAGGELIDHQDKLENALALEGPYAQAFAFAMGRLMDTTILDAAYGDAKTGESGGTTTSLPSDQKILNGSTGFTVGKLREAREKFLDADVDLDMTPVIAVITPKQQTQLLETTEVTSSDFNTVKALVNGEVNNFMGFNFVVSNRLLGASNYGGSESVVGSNIESAVLFTPDGLGLGIWDDMEVRVDERADKNYSNQVYIRASFGATRLQEEKVIRVDSDSTK